MNRHDMIKQLSSTSVWDVCVIGGGATGLGIAVDAASRGYKTILVEKFDFAKGTSSRSTKLVHGGVRYLQQGNIKLVMDALRERGLLLKNAPHLVKNQPFIVPNYRWWEGTYYGIGLKMYDWMAGKLGFGASKFLDREQTLQLAPTLTRDGLRGSVLYHDGQFDDARLAIHLAMTAADHGAALVNYAEVVSLLKKNEKINGVVVQDTLNNSRFEIVSKCVINATGVFTNSIQKLDDANAPELITMSQGIHLVFDREYLPSTHAIMIPRTTDKRVLFAVPWHNKIIAGTTDTPVDASSDEPVALKEEIDFVLQNIAQYLAKDPSYDDIRSIFAGLRPLVKGNARQTASLSRDHLVTISSSELITITGGKWTTYRKMAKDVVDIAMLKASLPERECKTEELKLHGYQEVDNNDAMHYYGSDKSAVMRLIDHDETLGVRLHPAFNYIKAEIVWAVRNEMCMTVEDALSRRTRCLLLDAKAAMDASPIVAQLISKELNKDHEWIKDQIAAFRSLAKNYLAVHHMVS